MGSSAEAAGRRPLAAVTGASAGIGREFCEQLAARGYDLLAVARDGARLGELRDALTARHGAAVEPLAADLTVDRDVTRVAERLARASRLALLVNNAGFGTLGPLAEADPGPQEAMVRLHVLAPMRLARAALPVLLRAGAGGIINVSSVAGFIASPGNANYCATKAYLIVLSQALAAETAGTGVRVQALCPGFTRSEFHRRAAMETGDIPGWLWLSAERVVRDSLAAFGRGGPAVCVPGLRYRLIVALIRLTPRTLLARLTDRRRRRS